VSIETDHPRSWQVAQRMRTAPEVDHHRPRSNQSPKHSRTSRCASSVEGEASFAARKCSLELGSWNASAARSRGMQRSRRPATTQARNVALSGTGTVSDSLPVGHRRLTVRRNGVARLGVYNQPDSPP
jgi:hypothetical protein